jgi:hypothetical protein
LYSWSLSLPHSSMYRPAMTTTPPIMLQINNNNRLRVGAFYTDKTVQLYQQDLRCPNGSCISCVVILSCMDVIQERSTTCIRTFRSTRIFI